jgi:Secretion system C-terminal sorting domain
MKILILILFWLTCFSSTTAQPVTNTHQDETVNGSHLAANISNNGNLFWKNGEGYFKIPYAGPDQPSPTTIRKAGLWIGGVDPGGNLKISASAVDSESGESDFQPGPLDPETGLPYLSFPENYFNFIWKVTDEEIIAHVEDWWDNHKIDHPIPAIMNWPGNGNPYFRMVWNDSVPTGLPKTPQGWAPFFDRNLDGIYDPLAGDFPKVEHLENVGGLIPKEMTWTVFNDQTEHPVTNGFPTGLEVQQTSWTMHCDLYDHIQNTVFVEYKFVNRAHEQLDDVHAGIWVDFDIGCREDDYIGSIPKYDSFYAYNLDNIDGDSLSQCQNGELSYGPKPPVQSVSFLNTYWEKEGSGFMYYLDDENAPPGMRAPATDVQFYNYLISRWKDGTYLSRGGTGYNPGSPDFTDFAFDGFPGPDSAWSQLQQQIPPGQFYALGWTVLNKYGDYTFPIQKGESAKLLVAFTYNRFPILDHLQIIDKMQKQDLFVLQNVFDYIANPCAAVPTPHIDPDEQSPSLPTGLYPNPATHQLHLSFPGSETEEISIFNTAGQLLYFDGEKKGDAYTIDLPPLPQGLYFLRLRLNGYYVTEKFVVGPRP